MINVNFCDIHRFEYDAFGITNQQTLLEWKDKFSSLLDLVVEQFPETRLRFYHTSVTRVPNVNLAQPLIADLNTAGAGLASAAGWEVFDLARILWPGFWGMSKKLKTCSLPILLGVTNGKCQVAPDSQVSHGVSPPPS